ncbi:MAG: FAD-binding oxidoreductase [Microbacteriaceae bacterium]|nr:FAD-binding oxidoreductase [Microbacteriaceae bacterium]
MGAVPDSAVAELRAALSADAVVHARGEAGYAEEAAGYNAASKIDTDFVIGIATEEDAVAVVRFAAAYRLPITIGATGHGQYRPLHEGVYLRTHRMRKLEIDKAAKTFTVGAGQRWFQVLPAIREAGLLAVTGSSPSVGIIGLTMGGGVGPLSRKLGIVADRILAYRVVTADGDLKVVTADSYPDLFQALKGGKVGLGLVTEATFQAEEMEHVYGGGLFFVGDAIAPVWHAWADWTKTLPVEATTSANIVRFPPVGVPELFAGRTVLHIRFAYVDPDASDEEMAAKGAALIEPIRAAGEVYHDTLGLLAADELGAIHLDPDGPLPMAVAGQGLVDIDHEFVDTLLSFAGDGKDVAFVATEVRHWGHGGAIEEAGVNTVNSIGGARAPYHLLTIATPVEELFAEAFPASRDAVYSALAKWFGPETNYNWAGSPDDEKWRTLWSPETAARLEATRAKYDPEHLFTTGH